MTSVSEESKLAIDEAEKAVEQWKVKKLISTLEAARGNGTSMISLIVPPKDQISRVSKMLNDEMGTASNIKSRVNRLSVITAIASTVQRLKLYNRVPTNGLVVYCGTVVTSEGKEKKINIDFEPFKPINTSLYLCDNKFHTEALNELLESDDKFGFIVMDGNGALFGVLSGNTRTVLHKFTVDLPKKHGRGGQSALRFARLRLEKRHNYLRKVAETAVQMFISNDRPNVSGLILAGSAEFKSKLNHSDLFDIRLQAIVTKIVDVSYGGENGFNQAIELASDSLLNVKFIREKKLLSIYFGEIAKDSQKYCLSGETMVTLSNHTAQPIVATTSDHRVLGFFGDGLQSVVNVKKLSAVDSLAYCSNSFKPHSIVSSSVHELISRPALQKCLEITCFDGRTLTLTPDHQVLAFAYNDSAFHWIPAKQLCRNDYCLVASFQGIVLPNASSLECQADNYAAEHTVCYFNDSDQEEMVDNKLHEYNEHSLEEAALQDELSKFSWLQRFSLGCLIGYFYSLHGNQSFNYLKFYGENSLDLEQIHSWILSVSSFSNSKPIEHPLNIPSIASHFISQVTDSSELWCMMLTNTHNKSLLVGFLRGVYGSHASVLLHESPACTSSFSINLQCSQLPLSLISQLLTHINYNHHCLNADRENPVLVIDGIWDVIRFASEIGFGANILQTARLETLASALKASARHSISISAALNDMDATFLWSVTNSSLMKSARWLMPIDQIIEIGSLRVHDLTVPLTSSFLAQGLVVHNCFGVKDTLAALDLGAVEELIVWESLDIDRFVLKNKETGVESIAYLTEKQEKDASHFKDSNGGELEVVDKMSLLEWLANNFKSFGAKLQFVTNKSQEGSQFVRGFGGIGGLLRYQVDFLTMDTATEDAEDDFI